MDVIRDIEPCRRTVREAQRQGRRVGLVPTMGALHEGHVSLIRRARRRCDYVAVTIFVNPTQFAPGEDYEQYPRTLEADLEVCKREGVDLVFAPSTDVMYAPDASTTVHVGGVTEGLCGPHRPGHFDGVATVVTKLFHILPADQAYFGEKDYQQMVMIRKMVRHLNVPIEIVACPTVREEDGLALSSRNRYLNPAERKQAVSLSRALFEAQRRVDEGERDASRLCEAIRETILAAGPARIEYVEAVDAETLTPLKTIDRPARICLAVRIGSCRLIDNVAVNPEGP
ncbi:MAG: pantoate--beta-alanine ligase [Planctomycetota bacterium]|nr:MAG: pantoate--beta-alanine ligase [Planctomycetota bacterium]